MQVNRSFANAADFLDVVEDVHIIVAIHVKQIDAVRIKVFNNLFKFSRGRVDGRGDFHGCKVKYIDRTLTCIDKRLRKTIDLTCAKNGNMAGTYSQVYIQVVFAVKYRENLLSKNWRDEVFKYMAGIIKEKGCKSMIVNGVEDHVHCFIGLKPACSISDLVRDIKNNSSRFINEKKLVKVKFQWQEGYGVFSYANSQVTSVFNYILNQEEHHRKSSFREEYLNLLKDFEIDYKDEFLFDWLERPEE